MYVSVIGVKTNGIFRNDSVKLKFKCFPPNPHKIKNRSSFHERFSHFHFNFFANVLL